MENDIKKEGRFWSAMGKVLTLVTILGGIILIWNFLTPSEYRLKAIGQHSVYALPSVIQQDVINLGKTDDSGNAIRIPPVGSQWGIDIENTGEKKITGIKLKMPFGGLYTVGD